MKKRFTEAQIIGFLRETEAGLPVKDLCRRHGFSEASYYLWRSKFGGMSVSDAKRLKELETENGRLKKLLAESQLEIEVTREVLRKKMAEDAPARAVCHASRTIADLAKVVNLATPHLRYRKDPAPAPCSAVFARLPEAAAQ